jgi:hypothetical protein
MRRYLLATKYSIPSHIEWCTQKLQWLQAFAIFYTYHYGRHFPAISIEELEHHRHETKSISRDLFLQRTEYDYHFQLLALRAHISTWQAL